MPEQSQKCDRWRGINGRVWVGLWLAPPHDRIQKREEEPLGCRQFRVGDRSKLKKRLIVYIYMSSEILTDSGLRHPLPIALN
jgi:hypothetical protein